MPSIIIMSSFVPLQDTLEGHWMVAYFLFHGLLETVQYVATFAIWPRRVSAEDQNLNEGTPTICNYIPVPLRSPRLPEIRASSPATSTSNWFSFSRRHAMLSMTSLQIDVRKDGVLLAALS